MFIKIQSVPLLNKATVKPDRTSKYAQTPWRRCFKSQTRESSEKTVLIGIRSFHLPADFQIFRLIEFASKTNLSQNAHFVRNGFDERRRFLIRYVRCLGWPVGNEPGKGTFRPAL